MRPINNVLANWLPQSTMGRIGWAAVLSAALLAWADLRLAVIPLGGFALLCAAAAFIPSSSFFLPVISRGTSGRKAVALTFDDGPDPLTTPALLRLMKEHRVSGTFFVTGHRVLRYPELARDIVAQGHSLGNHSFRHDLLGAFRSTATLRQEIRAAQRALNELGIVAWAYRPPMGITSPRLRRVMCEEGMFVVNFSCRAWDGGNRRLRNLSGRILKQVRADDILLLHENLPRPSLLPGWIGEVERILKGIREKGLEVLPLADMIGRPVMAVAAERDGRGGGGNGEPSVRIGPDACVPRSTRPDEQ